MIDWARIDELREEIGTEDFADIASLFLEEVTDTLNALDLSADPAVLSNQFHGLKGSALNLGFTYTATLCAEAETNPTFADPSRIRDSFNMAREALCARFPMLAR
jgi:HPt (histidine-containing phosphotransfer) domain-containing protein